MQVKNFTIVGHRGETFRNEAVFGSINNEVYNLVVAVRTVKFKTKKFVSHFITRVGDFENFNTSALAKHRILFARTLGALSDSRELEESDLAAGLTVCVVTDRAQPHLTAFVSV